MSEREGEYHYPKEIWEQPEAIKNTLDENVDERNRIVAKSDQVDRILLIGSGDCYFLGFTAVPAIEELSGLSAETVEAYDFYNTKLSLVSSSTLVIGISASGKSLYTVKSIEAAAERDALTVGLSNTEDSQLIQNSELSLLTSGGVSHTFPTKTTTTALASLIALASDIGFERGCLDSEQYKQQLIQLKDKIPQAIEAYLETELISIVADKLQDCRHFLFVGSGTNRGAAMIGAAKVVETCRRHVTVANAEEYLHLWGFGVLDNDGVIVLADGQNNHREQQAAEYAVNQGATVVVIGSSKEHTWPKGVERIDAGVAGLRVWSHSLSLMAALHSIANELSIRWGTNPDIPDTVDVPYVINLLYTGEVAGWRTTE